MLRRVLGILIWGAVLGGGFSSTSSHAARSVPRAPESAVLDEANVLELDRKKALEQLLGEHYRLAGDSISIALLDTLGGEPIERLSGQIFREWKTDRTDRNNGILFVVAWKEKLARLEVGIGQEASLSGKSDEILERSFVPAVKEHGPEAAVVHVTLELLKALESPVLSRPESKALITELESNADVAAITKPWNAPSPLIWLVALIGLLALGRTIYWILHPETHYSSKGEFWLKPRVWDRLISCFNDKTDSTDWGGTHGRWG